MNRKTILIPATAALLALGIFGTTAAYADTGPAKTDTAIEQVADRETATEAPETANEAPESATEAVEANEPALPGGGHADADGANVDNQFEGEQ